MLFFFFNDTATTEIYTLSLHDALPICRPVERPDCDHVRQPAQRGSDAHHRRSAARDYAGHTSRLGRVGADRKSTRLNSSHSQISYAVFCLKKKKIALISLVEEDRQWFN